MGSVRFLAERQFIGFAADTAFQKKLFLFLIIPVAGDVDPHVIQGPDKALDEHSGVLVRSRGEQETVFCFGIGVVSDDAGFKPGLHLCNHGKVIIDGQERKIWHLRIDLGVHASATDAGAELDVSAIPLKDRRCALAADGFPIQVFGYDLVVLQRDIVPVFIFAATKVQVELRRLMDRFLIKREGRAIDPVLENGHSRLFQFSDGMHHQRDHTGKGFEKIGLASAIRSVYDADRQQR